MFTQSRRRKFGARPPANRVQPYELARILQEANGEYQITQIIALHLRSSRVGRFRLTIIWDDDIFDPKQLVVQRVVDHIHVVRIGERPPTSVDFTGERRIQNAEWCLPNLHGNSLL